MNNQREMWLNIIFWLEFGFTYIMIKFLFLVQLLVFAASAQDDAGGGGDGMEEAKKLFTELHGESALEEQEQNEQPEPEDEPQEECQATKQDLEIYQAKQLSKIVLEEQIEKTKARLVDVKVQIQSLKYNIPTNEQSDECLDKTDCAACTKSPKCGWCAQEERCVAGDNIGPFFTNCNFYNFLYCAGECARYVDCDSCAKDTACGWCEDQPHIIIGCVLLDSDGIQCPPDYLIGDGTDKCPKRQIEIIRTVTTKQQGPKKKVKAEEPLEKKSARGWEDQYVMVRQGRYKERMKSLRENASAFGGAAAQSDLDLLLEEQADLERKLNKYQKQYKKLVAEDGEEEGAGGEGAQE